ncbi:MAG: DNA replication and repair protein RecF [Syntrophomonadaceae bacterium]|nr:DNA replication and repair protein RecF [Bacillota bacterium]
MLLQELYLANFRNFRELNISFHPKINVLMGENAQGKTNLLESISYLGSGRSFRTRNDTETIFWGKSVCVISGRVLRAGGENRLKIALDSTERVKKYTVDRVLKERHDYTGKLITVLFTPDDLQLVKGGPQNRRKYLDEEVCKVSPLYEAELTRYQHILRQRNQLLRIYSKKQSSRMEIECWDEELSKSAAVILRKRVAAAHRLNLLARLAHRRLTGGGENLEISYFSTVPFVEKNDEKKLAEVILASLASNFAKEVSLGVTLLGPHRDELQMTLNNRDARQYASQGQMRTLVLALKLAELEYIKGETGEFPVLLYDDVFSELDETRRRLLLEAIDGRVQTFITGTEVKNLLDLGRYGDVFRVKRGEVEGVASHGANPGADVAATAGRKKNKRPDAD